MRIVKHQMNEELAVRLLGWKWMSFVGRPVKSSPDYPNEVRVRQLLSSDQLVSQQWSVLLSDREGREANGDEPLAYTYCSSGCNAAALPKFTILVDGE